MKPDIWNETKKTVLFFNGCKTHGHMSNDCLFKDSKSKVTLSGKPYVIENGEFNRKLKIMKKENPTLVTNHEVMWECEFLRLIRSDERWKKFMKSRQLDLKAKARLVPRDAVLSGNNVVYNLFWTKEKNLTEKLIMLGNLDNHF